jgi:anti-anti-sigma factor
MAFGASLTRQGGTVIIDLEGDLDSTTAPAFRTKVEEAVTGELRRLVFDMRRLDYLSSAGLRGLVFASQKMGDGVELILVGTNDAVSETIRLTGFDQSVTFSERLPE